MKVDKIIVYNTDDIVPKDAHYLSSIVSVPGGTALHYFLIEVDEDSE